jgi:hypothetical protein
MSNSNSSSSASGGIGFAGLLTILFIGLKLTHYIDWSWLWVLSPLWIGLAVVLSLFVLFMVIAGVVAFFRS